MTHPEASNVKLVSTARLPAKVLLELCNAAVTIPALSVHNMREEDQDANGQETTAPTPVSYTHLLPPWHSSTAAA